MAINGTPQKWNKEIKKHVPQRRFQRTLISKHTEC